MSWISDYVFREPLIDLRGEARRAEALSAELQREVAPGHPLHGRSWRVIAQALPNDDVVAECGDEVAVVHLTWIRKSDRPPRPTTTFIASVDDLESYIESEYDWEP